MSDRFAERAAAVYGDPAHPASFGSHAKLARALNDHRGEKTEAWLRGRDAYTLHRRRVRKFRRRPTIVSGPGVQLQADLMDVSSHADDNDGVKFLLTAVDVFSKRAWAVPMRSKSGVETERALRTAFAGSGYDRLQTDKGREFKNVTVRRFLDEEGIKSFSSEDDTIKAAIVERFNRTLRAKIHRYLTHTKSKRYIDRLDDMIDAYNSSVHSSTGVAPRDVNETNAGQIFIKLYESDALPIDVDPRLTVGDRVRISGARTAFERGYTHKWTREIFVVAEVRHWERPVVYVIDDLGGERVRGTFYEQELQRVDEPEVFDVEKIVRRRGRGDRREFLVKWLGYPESFNSWVRASDFV